MTAAPERVATWVLRLYVNGASANSMAAVENIRRLCDEDLAGDVTLEIIDISEQPALVLADNVVAAPTLIKRLPGALRFLVGDLSDRERVREALDLGPIKT